MSRIHKGDPYFRMRLKLIYITVAALALLTTSNAHACDDCMHDVASFEQRISWEKIEFRTRKFLIGASSVMEWSVFNTENSGVEWIEANGLAGVEGTPIAPGATVLRITYNSALLGTHYHTVLWVDPETGAVLQYETSRDGRKAKHRIYRFTDKGAFQRTWYPEKGEKKLDWHLWTDRSGDYRPFQPEAQDQLVFDTLSLIYLIATSDLGRGTDEQSYLSYGNKEISRAVFTTGGLVDIDTSFYIEGPLQEHKCRGRFKALKINLEIQPVGNLINPDFGFLTEIELYLMPDTRIPVLISGRSKKLGKIVIKAKRVFTPEELACPEQSSD
ncbi:MAG: hypothetical protein E2O50_03885 [Gammaproteobacteria bacterium]|nr:MAG: hypothetical protein E2O50_03885 [Gammaproteobacteria bacterium]